MSRHEESFHIPIPPERAKQLCADAITSLGWPISNDLGYGLVSVESFQFGFNWPATVKVVLDHGDGRMSLIKIEASNFGFGPIQSSHVKGRAIALRERIEQLSHGPIPKAEAHSQPRVQSTPAKAPSQIFVNGVLLRQEQIDFLEKKYGSPLPEGNYWYDRMCGAWGVMGGPLLCTLEPNHEIGGPLQPGASNGNTGVFINGRELHYLDIALLQRVVPMIIPGRWWLDVYGNFGMEGSPMLGNLWTLAQKQGVGGNENRSSVLSSWERTGVAVFSG